jgi:hypothetical protein
MSKVTLFERWSPGSASVVMAAGATLDTCSGKISDIQFTDMNIRVYVRDYDSIEEESGVTSK